MISLQNIFYPKSVAIIGASRDEGSVGNDLVKNLLASKFDGKIYPINPKINEIYGLECFSSILEVEDEIDLVLIAVPSIIVSQIIDEAIKKQVKGVVIITSGFKEVGNTDLENEIKNKCAENNIALIGPNCLGVINTDNKLNASFAPAMPETGKTAFISQSGALCTAIIDDAKALGIGFSKFISLGNKAGIDEIDLLNYLETDKATKTIVIYAEQLTKPKELITVAKKLREKNKVVIVIKSGKSEDGAKASASHTGAMAGNDLIYQALFRQAGIIRAESVAELFDLITIFSNCQTPNGNRVAIVTNAGAGGVLACDKLTENKLTLAKLIDVLGDAKSDKYKKAIEMVTTDLKTDSVMVILTPQSMTDVEEVAKVIIEAKNKKQIPFIACFMGESMVSTSIQLMRQNQIPCFDFPEQAVAALGKLTKFGEIKREKEILFSDTKTEKIKFDFKEKKLTEDKATTILKKYGLTTVKSGLAKDEVEAENLAQKIGGDRVVLKIISADILHKSEVGGVMVGVKIDQVKNEFTEMMARVKNIRPEAEIEGILVEEMMNTKRGIELIVGATKDLTLGTTIMIGLGGIWVEIIKKVSFGLVPVSKSQAVKMIDELKINKIFEGFRNGPPLDYEAVVETIGKLSKLLEDNLEILELDINPLLVLPKGEGVRVLDARMILD